jgi:SAM-dependent methyltransferase
MSEKTAWYRRWFESPYYRLLYRHRDEDEAAHFIDNLVDYLQPSPEATMLDVACGNGRHAIYLRNKGYRVTGIDLSKRQIKAAQQSEDEKLQFRVFDMRKPFKTDHFDYVFNFFTSFGYFNNEADNLKTLKAFQQELKPGGTLVLDFLNAQQTAENIKEKETQTIKGVQFHIKRKVTEQLIIKQITVQDGDEKHHFQERVQHLTLPDFKRYMRQTHLSIKEVFGNYNLETFDEERSDRLILLAQKQPHAD